MTGLRALRDAGLPLTFDDVLKGLARRQDTQSKWIEDDEEAALDAIADYCRKRMADPVDALMSAENDAKRAAQQESKNQS